MRSTLVIVGLLAIGVTFFVILSSRQRPRPLGQPELLRHHGELWLSWTDTERDSYVFGYIQGYGLGASDGCRAMDRLFSLDRPRIVGDGNVPTRRQSALCEESIPEYKHVKTSLSMGLDPSAYTTVITDFYTKHPDRRDTMLLVLMDMLKGDMRPTADDLYSRLTDPQSSPR